MDRPGGDDETGRKHLQNAWTAPVSPAGQSVIGNMGVTSDM